MVFTSADVIAFGHQAKSVPTINIGPNEHPCLPPATPTAAGPSHFACIKPAV